ncbi:MAG: N-acetylneuraminate synthase family protein, partial [Deltaproteobacteria bacterium]|nr:N-acetylneuraminate synthase family protein [Deltaproteobacteria bacterium]
MDLKLDFFIGDRRVGKGAPAFIIAEAGVAHFGSFRKALRLVDLAVEAGADAVKFQVFRTDELLCGEAGDWKDRYREKEMDIEAFRKIKAHCDASGILFLATAHDDAGLLEVEALDVPAYKIGSGECQNWTFVRKVAEKGKPIILSTGMYTMEDIGDALEEIARAGNREV